MELKEYARSEGRRQAIAGLSCAIIQDGSHFDVSCILLGFEQIKMLGTFCLKTPLAVLSQEGDRAEKAGLSLPMTP